MSQFSREGEKQTLADLHPFPKDVYPVGRLDYESEGLLILTNDKAFNHKLLDPAHGHQRTYLVQVEGAPEESNVEILRSGITIKVNGKPYRTKPARVEILTTSPDLPPRFPPIRFRKNVADTWLRITLTEGKNRQVRKMTAAAGFPTLRLVREQIENLTVANMASGDVREMDKNEMYEQVFK